MSVTSAGEHPLHVAWQIQEAEYGGWTYGPNADERRIDCVQFLREVVGKLLRRPLRENEVRKILIQNISRSENLQELVMRGDARTRGIQHALLSMKRGRVVSPQKARSGDFVQYWYKKDGAWVGHAAIIQQVFREGEFSCAFIYGAHESLNAIGVAGFTVTLNDPQMKVYLIRFR